MHGLSMLLTLTGGLAGALVLGFIAQKLRLSPIVGYLLAGIAVGPFTPGVVMDREVAERFAEIGVILMLFGIGLRFHLRELLAVWRVAVPGALIQSALSSLLLTLLVRVLGGSWIAGLALGLSISVASTVVMALVLTERRDLHSNIGHLAIGRVVVEDMLTVVMLLILPAVFAPQGAMGNGIAQALGLAAIKVVGLVGAVGLLGWWVIPRALWQIERTRSRELFTLAVLVLALGIAVGSAELFGVSMALGAFLAGLAVGHSEFATRAAGDAVPMRDAFAVLFFVSVGMLFDPRSLLATPLLSAALLGVVLVAKPLATALTARALGAPWAVAIPVGATFAQVGEFTFILGSVARGLGLIDAAAWSALVLTAIVSIALNPSLYRQARRVTSTASGPKPRRSGLPTHVDPSRSILVGYGPVGQIVHHLLRERGTSVTVVDLNLDTVRRLRAEGQAAIYGDVLRAGTLDEAGIASAGCLILSADVEDAAEIIRQARQLNPELRVLARCTHLRAAAGLRKAGASVVAAGEAEVGVALAEAVTAGDSMDAASAARHREEIRKGLYEPRGTRGAPGALPSTREPA